LVAFTAETGIEVNYTEDYNDNNEAYAKYKPLLDKGQSLGVDIVTPTDWMAALWIQNGYAMKFDDANIPNKANLNEAYRNVSWDPGRSFSLPWQSGFAGFGWNKAKLKETLGTDKLTSMEQFFDPKLKGKVVVLSELRDTIPLVLSWQGNDPTNFTDDQFQKAIDFLQSKVDDGHIQAFTGNEYIQALEGGDVTAVIAWSGDIGQMGADYGFDLPETGGSIFVDNVLIPAGAEHKANAEKIINYFYDPVVAARVAAYVQYISPVNGAAEELLKTDPALAENPLIFPPDELLKRAYSAMTFTPEQAAKYSDAWAKLIGN
jgi:spermidine/putrescine transport system substrate-binding protein